MEEDYLSDEEVGKRNKLRSLQFLIVYGGVAALFGVVSGLDYDSDFFWSRVWYGAGIFVVLTVVPVFVSMAASLYLLLLGLSLSKRSKLFEHDTSGVVIGTVQGLLVWYLLDGGNFHKILTS